MSVTGRGTSRPRGARLPRTLASEEGDDAVWIAQRMVVDAGAQAARLRRQASAHAATVCEAAEREAEVVWQQASVQAAAIREAAEREAAQLRATVVKLSAAPPPRTMAPAEPPAKPGAGPATRSEPATTPDPPTRPARRPQSPPRQLVAVRVAAAATAALFLFALTAGTTELVLHGFAFFVFRSAGTGETAKNGLQEDQGPGQPDAPKPTPANKPTPGHIKAHPSPRTAATENNG